jgi:putative hydrolase of the HAD superfamily
VTPGEALHVGDTFEVDVAGARRAGIHAVQVLRDAPPGLADADVVADLTGVLDHPLYRQ